MAVSYLEPGRLGARGLGRLLREGDYDLLLLNGFFDRDFTLPALLRRRAGLTPRRPVLLSPRGEFAAGALSLKLWRKRAWLATARAARLLDGVALHATGPGEAADIRRTLPWAQPPRVAANVRSLFACPPSAPRPTGPLRLAFLGRLSPVKNLDYALQVLARVRAPVVYDVFGPQSDLAYAAACRALASSLPPHLVVNFRGEIANAQVPATLAGYDLLFLPTRGENFGHALFESLAAGTPVLVSDATPWRGLAAQKAGMDLPLGDPKAFAVALERFAGMDAAERAAWRAGARAAAAKLVAGDIAAEDHRRLMDALIAGGAGRR